MAIDFVMVWIVTGSLLIFTGIVSIVYIIFRKKDPKEDKRLKLQEDLKQLEIELKIDKDKKAFKVKEEKILEANIRADLVKKKSKDKKEKIISIEEEDSKLKPYDFLRTRRSKWSLKYWKDIFKERMWPEQTILVSMELLNGFHRQFLVTEKDQGFRYRGKKYIFDNESKYYNIDSKLWAFDYHEEFTLPIKRKIPISDIKKTLEHSNISEVEYATNPSTLERFIVARIAEGIMKGQQLDEFMKQIRLIMIITMVVAVSHMILFMAKTGIFQQIKIPGIN